MNKMRRSMLFVPGSNIRMIQKALSCKADSIIFDLEDSVDSCKKDDARRNVRDAVSSMNYRNMEIVVRINSLSTEYGYRDITDIIKAKPDALLLPKATEKDVIRVCSILTYLEKIGDIPEGYIKILVLVETTYGLIDIYNIIRSSYRVDGVLFGAEDFATDIEVKRTRFGEELLYARSKIAVTCKACGIDAIDTPYTSIDDEEGFVRDINTAKLLGMVGKTAIHPKQVEMINKLFTPDEDDVAYAEKVLENQIKLNNGGEGAFNMEGKMIDAPMIERAKKIMQKAKIAGIK